MAMQDIGTRVINGGLVTGLPPHAITINEAQVSENVDPSYPLGLKTRRGSSAYGVTLPTSASGAAMTGLRVWTRDLGTTFHVFAVNTTIYSADGNSALSIKTGMATDSIMNADALNNMLVVVASGLFPQISSAGSSLASITEGTYLPSTARAKYITEYGSKLWISGDTSFPSRVIFCKAGDPEDWSSVSNAGNADIGAGDGDIIRGLAGTRRALYLFKRKTTYALTGDTTANYKVDPVCEWGLVSERGFASDGQGCFFASDDGVYYLNGLNASRISDPVRDTYDGISDKSTLTMEIKGDKLFIFYKDSGSQNNKALVCGFKRKMSDGSVRGVWGIYTGQPWSVADTSRANQLYVGTNTGTLQIYEIDTGSPGSVDCLWRTPDMDFDSFSFKTLMRYFVHQKADTATTTLTVRTYVDGASHGSDATLSFGTTTEHQVQMAGPLSGPTGRFLGLRLAWTGDKTFYGIRVYADVRADDMTRR